MTCHRPLHLVVALAALALVDGCSGSKDDPGPGPDDDPSETTTTQPSAGDSDAAFPIIEDLVLEATAIADDLFQDPTAVSDPDNPDIERLRELYTDDSPTPDGVVAQLEDLADKGHRERAAANGIFRDLGVYQLSVVDDDTVRFRVCALVDTETIDEDDTVVATTSEVVQGVGEARRSDGTWRFYGINPDDDRTLPIAPGSGEPGFCDALFAGEAAPAT